MHGVMRAKNTVLEIGKEALQYALGGVDHENLPFFTQEDEIGVWVVASIKSIASSFKCKFHITAHFSFSSLCKDN